MSLRRYQPSEPSHQDQSEREVSAPSLLEENLKDYFGRWQNLPAWGIIFFFLIVSQAQATFLFLHLSLELGISRAEWLCANCHF